jgi:hypothetical protein
MTPALEYWLVVGKLCSAEVESIVPDDVDPPSDDEPLEPIAVLVGATTTGFVGPDGLPLPPLESASPTPMPIKAKTPMAALAITGF